MQTAAGRLAEVLAPKVCNWAPLSPATLTTRGSERSSAGTSSLECPRVNGASQSLTVWALKWFLMADDWTGGFLLTIGGEGRRLGLLRQLWMLIPS